MKGSTMQEDGIPQDATIIPAHPGWTVSSPHDEDGVDPVIAWAVYIKRGLAFSRAITAYGGAGLFATLYFNGEEQ